MPEQNKSLLVSTEEVFLCDYIATVDVYSSVIPYLHVSSYW